MWCVGVGNVDVACDLQLDVCMLCGVSGLEMWTWRVTCSGMCAWYVVCRGWKSQVSCDWD